MKKWNASMQQTFEDLPRNVRTWREALRRASQTLEGAWETTPGKHDFPNVATLLRGNKEGCPATSSL